MSINDPQPPPLAGNARHSVDLLVELLLERKAMGVAKYGVAHQHDNGRDHLVDALQEALDLGVYLVAEVAALRARMPRQPFDVRCADALADEVAMLIKRKALDARSPAGDALLDYRNPPSTPRADRLAALELVLQEIEKRALHYMRREAMLPDGLGGYGTLADLAHDALERKG